MLATRMRMAAANAEATSVTFLGSAVDGTNAASHTFSSKTFGDASASRVIAVAISSSGVTSNATISSVTIGGVSATRRVGGSPTSGGLVIEIWSASVPTGTSGDIVVTHSGTKDHCGIGWWRLTSVGSVSVTDATVGSDTSPYTATIDVTAGGVVLAMATGNSAATFTWSGGGIAENYDGTIEGNYTHSGASELSASGGSGVTYTATASADSGADDGICVCCFDAA